MPTTLIVDAVLFDMVRKIENPKYPLTLIARIAPNQDGVRGNNDSAWRRGNNKLFGRRLLIPRLALSRRGINLAQIISSTTSLILLKVSIYHLTTRLCTQFLIVDMKPPMASALLTVFESSAV